MAELLDHDRKQLVVRLSNGFAALLKQVDELKRHREAMEHILGNDAEVVCVSTESDRAAQDFAISDGKEAFEALKDRKNNEVPDGKQAQVKSRFANPTMPPGHPDIQQNGSRKVSCPFAQDAKRNPIEQLNSFEIPSPLSHRQNSPPTPPDTSERYVVDNEAQPTQTSPTHPPAAPISVSGSLSKCPIRLLDERPPEEIAEYFETHKHEIPRSHEVCVKRYQSNEQSIRQLDAKYGNLVNMIKGLGMKHQPLLPHQDEGLEANAEEVGEGAEKKPSGSITKVENWVGDVRPTPLKDSNDEVAHSEILSERDGRFDRPLREIRVGESPSRPWGISVPAATVPKVEDIMPDHGRPEAERSPSKEHLPTADSGAFKDIGVEWAKDSNSNLVFQGPVFIGYPPEQAAIFLKQFGARQ